MNSQLHTAAFLKTFLAGAEAGAAVVSVRAFFTGDSSADERTSKTAVLVAATPYRLKMEERRCCQDCSAAAFFFLLLLLFFFLLLLLVFFVFLTGAGKLFSHWHWPWRQQWPLSGN